MTPEQLGERSRRFRAEGLCRACGAECAPGRKCCEEHLRYQRQHHKEIRAARRAGGLCIVCGEKSVPGGWACARCKLAAVKATRDWRARKRADRASHRTWDGEFRKRRIEAGRCYRCDMPRDTSATACSTCSVAIVERHLELRLERRAAGLCRCGRKPRPGFWTCRKCNSRDRRLANARRARLRELGRCLSCSRPATDSCQLCEEHREAQHARQRMLARRKRAVALRLERLTMRAA